MTYQLLPTLSQDEYESLKASIAKHGILSPIEVDENGEILDGHHRIRACQELGINSWPTITKTFGSELEKQAYVYMVNLARRQISRDQLKEIRKEQKKLALALKNPDTSQEEIAGLLGVDQTTISRWLCQKDISNMQTHNTYIDLRTVIPQKARDDIYRRAQTGETQARIADNYKVSQPRISQVLQEIELDKLRKAKIKEIELPKKRYKVIYADPPWKYDNRMPAHYFTEQAHHYPLMTVEEICDLGVKDIVEDNAVLFLWATSPILEEAFQVIHAWGFDYKASFVWDKEDHVMGHYNSVRHEFLLVCTRGSCQPEVKKLYDSVVSIKRTKHSEKPEFFREIIDTIYPNGERIELFARKEMDGWDSFGDEVVPGREKSD